MASDSDLEVGSKPYMHEPQWEEGQESDTSSDTDSDSTNEASNVVKFEGRCKTDPAHWCRCGKCTRQNTDGECYCCMEHELLLERIHQREIKCFTEYPRLEEYVAHKPSLEMAYIQGMMRGSLRGPAPDEGEFTQK
jgi:hypothetical protein